MELPYYMTPLVGALAWAVIAGAEERLRQPALEGGRRHAAICSTSIPISASPG